MLFRRTPRRRTPARRRRSSVEAERDGTQGIARTHDDRSAKRLQDLSRRRRTGLRSVPELTVGVVAPTPDRAAAANGAGERSPAAPTVASATRPTPPWPTTRTGTNESSVVLLPNLTLVVATPAPHRTVRLRDANMLEPGRNRPRPTGAPHHQPPSPAPAPTNRPSCCSPTDPRHSTPNTTPNRRTSPRTSTRRPLSGQRPHPACPHHQPPSPAPAPTNRPSCCCPTDPCRCDPSTTPTVRLRDASMLEPGRDPDRARQEPHTTSTLHLHRHQRIVHRACSPTDPRHSTPNTTPNRRTSPRTSTRRPLSGQRPHPACPHHQHPSPAPAPTNCSSCCCPTDPCVFSPNTTRRCRISPHIRVWCGQRPRPRPTGAQHHQHPSPAPAPPNRSSCCSPTDPCRCDPNTTPNRRTSPRTSTRRPQQWPSRRRTRLSSRHP